MFDEKELKQRKQEADKLLLKAEILMCLLGVSLLFAFMAIALLAPMPDYMRVAMILVGLAPFMAAMLFALKIEQRAGYYECAACKARYVPTYMAVTLAPHIGRTRYMKCPHCSKRAWHKKTTEC